VGEKEEWRRREGGKEEEEIRRIKKGTIEGKRQKKEKKRENGIRRKGGRRGGNNNNEGRGKDGINTSMDVLLADVCWVWAQHTVLYTVLWTPIYGHLHLSLTDPSTHQRASIRSYRYNAL